MKTLIKMAQLLLRRVNSSGDLLIEGEIIKEIGVDLNTKADTVVDAAGKFVLPGGIDQHTHYLFWHTARGHQRQAHHRFGRENVGSNGRGPDRRYNNYRRSHLVSAGHVHAGDAGIQKGKVRKGRYLLRFRYARQQHRDHRKDF